MIPTELNSVNDIYQYFVANTPPDKVVMGFFEKPVTMAELVEKVERFTRHLIGLGVKQGSMVGYTMPNCPETFYMFIAISGLGGCAVPLFHMLPDMAKVDVYCKSKVDLVVTTAAQLSSFKEASK